MKVMKTLLKAEDVYENLGRSMQETFFPGELRPEEEAEWEVRRE
jgi:hypothetical protein